MQCVSEGKEARPRPVRRYINRSLSLRALCRKVVVVVQSRSVVRFFLRSFVRSFVRPNGRGRREEDGPQPLKVSACQPAIFRRRRGGKERTEQWKRPAAATDESGIDISQDRRTDGERDVAAPSFEISFCREGGLRKRKNTDANLVLEEESYENRRFCERWNKQLTCFCIGRQRPKLFSEAVFRRPHL